MIDYDEAVADVLARFEQAHRATVEAEDKAMIEQSRSDPWLWGQLHLRSLSDPCLRARMQAAGVLRMRMRNAGWLWMTSRAMELLDDICRLTGRCWGVKQNGDISIARHSDWTPL